MVFHSTGICSCICACCCFEGAGLVALGFEAIKSHPKKKKGASISSRLSLFPTFPKTCHPERILSIAEGQSKNPPHPQTQPTLHPPQKKRPHPEQREGSPYSPLPLPLFFSLSSSQRICFYPYRRSCCLSSVGICIFSIPATPSPDSLSRDTKTIKKKGREHQLAPCLHLLYL